MDKELLEVPSRLIVTMKNKACTMKNSLISSMALNLFSHGCIDCHKVVGLEAKNLKLSKAQFFLIFSVKV